jgi:glycosyltransferase involved in cell wall biosynthesis
VPLAVSIIVPTYRREGLLRDTLTQVLAQDYPRCEVLVIDQSREHEAETQAFLAAHADRLRCFRLEKPNLPAARNFGIRQSTGDIIVFLDDDIVIPDDCVSKLVATYDDDEVWGATGFTLGHAETDDQKYVAYAHRVSSRDDFNRLPRIKVTTFNGCLMSFRRAMFDRVGFFDEWIGTQPMAAGEDGEFCQRAVAAGCILWLNPRLTVRHLEGKDGGCGRRSLPAGVARSVELNILVYTLLKNRRFTGPMGWLHSMWRCYRQVVLNRTLLQFGPRALLQRHRELAKRVVANIATIRSLAKQPLQSPSGRSDARQDSNEAGRSRDYGGL